MHKYSSGIDLSMEAQPDNIPRTDGGLEQYPLLTALRERRSRRMGLGMKIPGGPLAFESRHKAKPLTEAEEAALVFAALDELAIGWQIGDDQDIDRLDH